MNGPPEIKASGPPGPSAQSDQADLPDTPASEPPAYLKRQFAANSFRCKLCNRIMAESLPGAPPAAGLCLLCSAEFNGGQNGFN